MPRLSGQTVYKAPEGVIRPEGRATVQPAGVTTLPSVGGRITVGGTTPAIVPPATIPFGVTEDYTPSPQQSAKSGNLAATLQIPDLENPSLQPPIAVPQRNQPTINLPDAFSQGLPSIYPPLTIRNGITMPSATPGVKPQTYPSMNWSDFLTIAHNAYTR